MDLIIKPTQRCNFKCTFCSSTDIAESNQPSSDLDPQKVERFLERFPKTRSIIVNGGDPLMMKPDYYWRLLAFCQDRKLSPIFHLITNLWDYYCQPQKWRELFHHPLIKVGTSFQFGSGRRISKEQVFSRKIFVKILNMFKAEFNYTPSFIAVINEENDTTVLQTVELAKELGIECKINYARKSGEEDMIYPIGRMYHHYLDIYEAGLSDYEFNTKQILKKLKLNEFTICPSNRSCDEGIRNLQPKSETGFEYGSCGAFGDDQKYGINFDQEMTGEVIYPLRSKFELRYQKEECLTCENFELCNGCYKTTADLIECGLVEESCHQMKKFRERAVELGLI